MDARTAARKALGTRETRTARRMARMAAPTATRRPGGSGVAAHVVFAPPRVHFRLVTALVVVLGNDDVRRFPHDKRYTRKTTKDKYKI